MTPDSIKELAFSIGRAQTAAAQAAHDARQPEIDRLRAENARMRAALNKIVTYWGNLHPKDLQQARAALAKHAAPEHYTHQD